MTLHHTKGDIVFECDACNDTLETATSNFDSARNILRMEHWQARKVGDVWSHYCEGCSKEAA